MKERYCTMCGARLDRDSEACPGCGRLRGEEKYNGIKREGAGGIGYSTKTDDPSFTAQRKKTKLWGLVVIAAIAVIVCVVLIIAGAGAALAAIVSAILLVIMGAALLITQRKKSSYEGRVEEKLHRMRGGRKRPRSVYETVITDENGKKHKVSWSVHTSMYDYLCQGDRVRYIGEIGGQFAFEKYDKSRDLDICCAGCGFAGDCRHIYCAQCGCLILKGNAVC